jgi:hypothetical protein
MSSPDPKQTAIWKRMPLSEKYNHLAATIRQAREHTRRVPAASCEISLAPPEYVIIHKLGFYKESQHQRQLRDIAGMIGQQELDHTFPNHHLEKLHLTGEYNAALALTDRG